MASSAVATLMRGAVKRVTTPHRQMSMMVNKRFLSSSSSTDDSPASTKYLFTDNFPNSVVRQNDIPKTKDNTDGNRYNMYNTDGSFTYNGHISSFNDWEAENMRTKSQTNIAPESGGMAPSPTPSWPGTDESSIKRKMDLMAMFRWHSTSYDFCDGVADEDKDGMYVKILVPEIGKEDIKEVLVEQKVVKPSEAPDVSRTLKMTMRVKVLINTGAVIEKNYSTPFFVKPEIYEMCHVWAQVNHGVLRIFIPKAKPAMIKDDTFPVKLA